MKRAKVSSVYEGGGIKRGKEEEERSSRRARMKARARKHACRANVIGQPFVGNEKMMKTRSMITRMVEEKKEKVHVVNGQKKLHNEVVAEPEIDNEAVLDPKSNDINGEIVDPETGGSEAIAEPMDGVILEKYWEEEPVWWEEYWPMCWSYEEKWTWSPYWEMVSGIGCGGDKQDKEEAWEDDIWNLRDINEDPNMLLG